MSESFTEKYGKKKEAIKPTKASDDLKPKSLKSAAEKTKTADDKKNFMDHVINSRGDLCYKVTGKDITGEIAWYFILVDKDKKEAFLKHESGDSYNLEDYGKIIVSGSGTEVPEDVQEMLKDKYGFDNF